jgi:hypothetical protein
LDAFNALNVIETIKKLAKEQNKIIIMTIHQPRTDILRSFDKIVLLSAGRTVFFGPLDASLAYFEKHGFPLPSETNPSDFFLDIITPDQRSPSLREKANKRIVLFQEAWATESQNFCGSVSDHHADDLVSRGWPNFWLTEFFVLLQRNLRDVIRDRTHFGASIFQTAFVTILLGFMFFRVSNDSGGVQNRIGFLFFTCANLSFGTIETKITWCRKYQPLCV